MAFTGTLGHLALAVAVFVIGHFVMGSRLIRPVLTQRLGRNGYKGVFSLISGASLLWAIFALNDAPHLALYDAPVQLRHITVTLMLAAIGLVVLGAPGWGPNAESDPTNLPPPKGIHTVTRHPSLWGIAFWALLHILANGDAAAWIFFGGMAVLAVGGTAHLDRRKAREWNGVWQAWSIRTSNLPFAAIIQGKCRLDWAGIGLKGLVLTLAIWAFVLAVHGWLFGVQPVPMPW